MQLCSYATVMLALAEILLSTPSSPSASLLESSGILRSEENQRAVTGLLLCCKTSCETVSMAPPTPPLVDDTQFDYEADDLWDWGDEAAEVDQDVGADVGATQPGEERTAQSQSKANGKSTKKTVFKDWLRQAKQAAKDIDTTTKFWKVPEVEKLKDKADQISGFDVKNGRFIVCAVCERSIVTSPWAIGQFESHLGNDKHKRNLQRKQAEVKQSRLNIFAMVGCNKRKSCFSEGGDEQCEVEEVSTLAITSPFSEDDVDDSQEMQDEHCSLTGLSPDAGPGLAIRIRFIVHCRGYFFVHVHLFVLPF